MIPRQPRLNDHRIRSRDTIAFSNPSAFIVILTPSFAPHSPKHPRLNGHRMSSHYDVTIGFDIFDWGVLRLVVLFGVLLLVVGAWVGARFIRD